MEEGKIKKAILDMMDKPGWTTARGVLKPVPVPPSESDYILAERVMRDMAQKGLVSLWQLIVQDRDEQYLVAARPGFELDKELEQRQAWAKAVRLPDEQ